MKNWSYKITEGEHAGKTLWSGRYTAVAAFVFLLKDNEWFVLTNKRGAGTPDFQGLWNCVCGFLEADECAQEGCSREVFEETGVKIPAEKFLNVYVQTDPETSNNGNVTIRHMAVLFDRVDDWRPKPHTGGEENEVDEVYWMPLGKVQGYEWAFGHNKTIAELFGHFLAPLMGSNLTEGIHYMLGHKKWLEANPQIMNAIRMVMDKSNGIY